MEWCSHICTQYLAPTASYDYKPLQLSPSRHTQTQKEIREVWKMY